MLHVHAVTISLFTVHTASTLWYHKTFIVLIQIPPTLVDISLMSKKTKLSYPDSTTGTRYNSIS
jgi:hypothetical protein